MSVVVDTVRETVHVEGDGAAVTVQSPRHGVRVLVEGPSGAPGPAIIVQPEPPPVDGLPEGVMWVDEDSSVDPATGAGGGVTDHGLLTGLLDDDHRQYMMARWASGSGFNFDTLVQEGQWIVMNTDGGTVPPGVNTFWLVEVLNYSTDWTMQRAYNPFNFATTPEIWERGKTTAAGDKADPRAQVWGAWRRAGGGGMDQATADARYVNVDGDEMTGDLTISKQTPAVVFNRPDPTNEAGFVWATNGSRRWTMRMGTGEPGGNSGSAWEVVRHDDSGNVIDIPFTVYRNDGFVSMNGLYCGYASFDGPITADSIGGRAADLALSSHINASGKTIWGLPTPTAADWAATKGYVDGKGATAVATGSALPAASTVPRQFYYVTSPGTLVFSNGSTWQAVTLNTYTAPPAGGYSGVVLSDTPRLYLRLGDTSGTTAIDSSGSARNGTYNGTYTLAQSSLIASETDKAALLNTGYVQVPYGSWMNSANLTMEMIVKPNGVTGTQILLARYNVTSTARNHAAMYMNAAQLVVRMYIGGVQCDSNTGFNLAAGATYHLAATWDGTSVRVYANGVLKSNTPFTGVLQQPTSNGWWVGAWEDQADLPYATQRTNSVVDEVAVYGTALSAARILAHAQAAGF